MKKTGILPLVMGFLIIAIPFFATPIVHAQGKSGKAMVLGKADSSRLKALGKSKEKVNGRKAASEAKKAAKGKNKKEKLKNALKNAKGKLKGVDVVLANLKEIKPDENDALIVKAATDLGIPVTLENVTSDKMAKLTGAGVDAELVVLESRSNGNELRINAFGGPQPKLATGKRLKKTVKRTADDIPKGKKEPGKKEQLKWKITDEVGEQGKSRVKKRPSSVAVAAKIIKEKKWAKGGKKQTLISNKCPVGNSACREWEVWWYAYTWHPAGVAENHILHPGYSFGQYRLNTSGNNLYTVFRFQGDIGTNTTWNSSSNRGYFLDAYRVYANVTSMPRNWHIDKMSPKNGNDTGSLSSTTGWSVGGSVGADTSGPNAAISGSYSESSTFSSDVRDFSVTRTRPSANKVQWDYKMTKSSGAEYNSWDDLVDYSFGSADLHGLPAIARGGNDLLAEVSFTGTKGPTDCSERMRFSTEVRSTVRRTYIVSDFWEVNWYTSTRQAWWPGNWSVCTNWYW